MSEDKISKIVIGMTADELFELFPQSMQIKKPDVFTDENNPEDLIVIHHFQGVDVRLERASNTDPLFPLTAYAVQEVIRV